MKKNFVLTPEMLGVLGEECSSEKISIITNSLTRNWAFLIYPESMPTNWLDILESFYIPFAVSPLHDKDINPDGTPKKPHYHILLTSDNKKSFQQLFDIARLVNGSYLINVGNAGGYYRYFTHIDHPDKYQYNSNDIRCYCGFNSDIYDKPNSSQRHSILKQMLNFVERENIFYFVDLVNYCLLDGQDDWFSLLSDNSTVFITKFIDSRRNKHYEQLNK